MEFEQLVASITPATFEKLIQAVETGRWADGVQLSDQQKEYTVQLVLAYQAKYLPSDEPFRVGKDGLLVTKSKREMRDSIQPNQTIATFNLASGD